MKYVNYAIWAAVLGLIVIPLVVLGISWFNGGLRGAADWAYVWFLGGMVGAAAVSLLLNFLLFWKGLPIATRATHSGLTSARGASSAAARTADKAGRAVIKPNVEIYAKAAAVEGFVRSLLERKRPRTERPGSIK